MKLGVLEERRMVLDLWSSLGSLSGQVSLLNQILFRRFFLCVYKIFARFIFVILMFILWSTIVIDIVTTIVKLTTFLGTG